VHRLTSDHVWEHPELKNVLSRAVGLDRHFQLDFCRRRTAAGDCFLLCSDGVWAALGTARLQAALLAHPDAQQAAASLTSLALACGGQDNASAVVLRVPSCRRRTCAMRSPARRACRCRRDSSRARNSTGCTSTKCCTIRARRCSTG
jgi:serine/threonine protein phosphatase PrpC